MYDEFRFLSVPHSGNSFLMSRRFLQLEVGTHYVGLYTELSFIIFTISTSPIIHVVCPPKFCISIVLSFSWDDCMPKEKLKTILMQNFGGKQRVLWGI